MAKRFSTETAPFTADDVVLTFGCSGSLYTAMSAICEVGDNIIMASPAFPLAKTINENIGVETRTFRLLPDREFEVDLEHAESLVDD